MVQTTRKPPPPPRPRPVKRAGRRPRGTGAGYDYDNLKGQIEHLELMPGTLLDESDWVAVLAPRDRPFERPSSGSRPKGSEPSQSHLHRRAIRYCRSARIFRCQLLYRLSARLAAHNPSPSIIARIRVILDEHERTLKARDIHAMIRLNHEFHTAIAEMSGNLYIARWFAGLLARGTLAKPLRGSIWAPEAPRKSSIRTAKWSRRSLPETRRPQNWLAARTLSRSSTNSWIVLRNRPRPSSTSRPVLPNPELRPPRFLAYWTYIIDEPKAAVST
jgi:FCD domain